MTHLVVKHTQTDLIIVTIMELVGNQIMEMLLSAQPKPDHISRSTLLCAQGMRVVGSHGGAKTISSPGTPRPSPANKNDPKEDSYKPVITTSIGGAPTGRTATNIFRPVCV